MTRSRTTHPSRMTPNTDASPNPAPPRDKPRLAYAIATALGTGYLRPSPGTYGSLVGVATIVLSAIFFLHPASVSDWFSRHPLSEAMFADKHFLMPGSDIHDTALALPLLCALVLLLILGAIGVWSSARVAEYSGQKDPQYVVIDEVAGQHLTLLLPLIPIALPHLSEHFDFSGYAIFFALSLVNCKYRRMAFILS